MIKFLVDENGLEHCVNNEYKVADTIEELAHPESKEPKKSIMQRIKDWIASQKPLDPDAAKLLEENLWKLV
jgi:ferritin